MSASGEGEQISDISKDDDESEVTSTTRDNSGRKPSLCPTSTDSTFPIINTDSAIPIAADTAPGALQHVNEDVPLVIPPTDFVDDGKALDELDIDPNVASTTAMPMEDEVSKPVIQTTVDSDQNTQTSAPEDVPNSEDNIATEESVIDKDFNLGIEPKSSVIKEINEIIQADADKDSSSLGEELELRWEDDDDDENDETLQTADVLKQLDQELEDIGGSDVSQEANKETEIVAIKPESLVENIDENIKESTKNPEPIEDSSKTLHDKSSDVDNANLDVQMLSCNDASEIENNIDENSKIKDNNDMEIKGETSFEESQPIIDQIDSLTKSAEDIEMEKAMDIPVTKIIEPQTDQIDSLTKEDLDQDIEMENLIESEKPVKVAEITSVSSPKDFEEMDVDTSSVNVITVPTIAENTLVPIESTKQLNLNRIQNVNSEVLDNKDTQRATMEVSKNAAVLEKPDQNDGSTNISDVSSVILPLEAVNDDESHKIITSSGVSSVTLQVLNTDESEKIITTSNVPTTLPLEVLNIIDKAEPESDCETKEAPSQPPTCEQLSKDTKNKLDDIQDVDINASQLENDSLLETTITPNVHHRINKPNVMLDIPTQELSDIEAELDNDDSENEDNNGDKTHEGIKIDVVENSPKLDASLTDDIDMKDSNNTKIVTESCDTSTPAPIIKVIISPTIEIDATSSKLNITTVSPAKSETSKSIQLPSLSKKLQFDDIKPTTSQPEQDIDVDAPSSSKVEHETDDTSKSVEIDCEKPSSSKPVQNNDDEKPSTSKINQETDDEKPSTSKIVQETDDEKPSTSKIVPETDDEKPTSTITQETDDEKPSTSKPDVTSGKLTPDNIDSVQEVTDSLGLLAESSRVMDDDNDDDDDADDPEADDNDNDDDEDFDPYEETNSEIADDMDDSNTPPPELDPKMDQPESSKVLEERESDEGTMDITEGTMDIVDDIECVENELPEMELPDDAVSETPSNEDNARKEDESDIIDADTLKDKSTTKCPPEKIINILEKVLGQTGAKCKDSSSVVGNIRSYVELEGSSDSDDVLEVSKSDVMSVNIPKDVEVMSTSGPHGSSEIVSRKGEVVINWVAKPPPPQKMSKINTSEVTIKTTGTPSPSIHIPETTSVKPKAPKEEIFSLDSDEEDTEKKKRSDKDDKKGTKEEPSKSAESKCINPDCTSENQTYYQADRATAAYYSLTRRSAVVCEQCRQRASERSEALLNGIKDLRPLLELDMTAPSQQLVEISDSDSDGEGGDDTPLVGERGAVYLEEHLADMINQTWAKYKMDSRLKDTETYLMAELDKIQAGAKEIDAMLDECQKKTDSIRLDFYKDYELRRKSLGAIIIHDTPFSSFCCNEEKQSGYSHTEKDVEETAPQTFGSRYPKRRAASIADTPAKRPAIPMGYLPLDADKMGTQTDGPTDQNKDDDKEDISVVKLSAESAPADLPPCGEIVRPPLKNGMIIYAMRNAFGTWLKGKIMDVIPKAAGQQFTQCRVKFEHKVKNPCKVLAARCLAYPDPCEVRMTIGTRVVALFKDPHNTTRRDSFYSGVIAEIPNPVNNYRYLVFFDDGYAQYVHHQDTRIVCESSNLVWEEVHPFIRDFICNYLLSYPERPMVRLHAGEKLKTEWNGKWWDSKVLQVDASIALINFDEDNRTEWIYRGSTRLAPLYLELQAAEKAGEGRTRSRLPRSKAQMRSNMPCVEYTRSDEQAAAKATAETQAQQQHNEEMRRQRSVAKKSTTTPAQPPTFIQGTPFEGVISRVVYYTPKNAVKPYKMSPHTCTAKCRRSDLLSLKDLRTYNPLAKPLLSGWERQTVRYKGHRAVAYRAPCGRRVRGLGELHRYLRTLHCDLPVDLFDFTPGTHCLAEFVLHKCIVSKKDLSHGKENVPVPCVNYYDDSLPEFCSYNTERTPTAGVPLNLDPEFLCGCDCTDDCMDKSKCDCWKMTLEGARTIGLDGPNVGYVYRRLPEPLPSGIYECNSRCKCKQTCLNRVAQHPLQLKLQVFKTINRGWGIRALNDVPKGSFLCVYAGNLLTDATANLDGLNEGDEYLAELDYIEVVEAMKEGYEDDVPDADKQLDKKRSESDSESEPSSESEDERDKTEKDGDFQPGYIPHSNVEFRKSLRKRQKAKKKEELEKQKEAAKKRNDCITISDDEEVREPSRFTAQAGMVDKDLISKHSSRVSVRTLFGKDEACYIMDAKVQGNIGRYLNHSCHPNVFVQNVFVDTHDPRFPWVAFFALAHVRAGTELTWNYNYDIGSVPEKVLYCYCGAPNCRGRLL